MLSKFAEAVNRHDQGLCPDVWFVDPEQPCETFKFPDGNFLAPHLVEGNKKVYARPGFKVWRSQPGRVYTGVAPNGKAVSEELATSCFIHGGKLRLKRGQTHWGETYNGPFGLASDDARGKELLVKQQANSAMILPSQWANPLFRKSFPAFCGMNDWFRDYVNNTFVGNVPYRSAMPHIRPFCSYQYVLFLGAIGAIEGGDWRCSSWGTQVHQT